MKKKRQYESRVKRNAVIIYLLASLLCVGMLYYISNLKKAINFQKDNIEKNETILSLTNDFIENVNVAQALVNVYSFSTDGDDWEDYDVVFSKISNISDSIFFLCDDELNESTLEKVEDLLIKKKHIAYDISCQLKAFNPYQEIYSIIYNYQPKQKNTAVSKTTCDTIIYRTEKKRFLKRLGEVFSPDKSLDSMVLVSKTTIDTIYEDDDLSYGLLTDIHNSTEKGRKNYIEQIKSIESRYNNLILSDQQISKEISDLLIVLHKHTLDSVIEEIEKSEFLINKNINLSILLAIVALLVILTFILFIFYDLKKVAAAREATEKARQRTEEIMESRHKLLLSVSHDVKAPLSSILGYLELMQIDNGNAADDSKISSMRTSANHILSLMTNLLNYSRLDQGKESVILSDFNVSELCDELACMFEPLAEKKQLSFVYDNNIDHCTFVKSDALKIKQIVSNLLSNAIKYTNKGKVTFVVGRNEEGIVIGVGDDGIGIPEDKLVDIYRPFSRIDNKESLIEGNGFGLFVVKGLVDLMGGIIEVESELNKGSDFKVTIPVEFVESVEEKTESVDVEMLYSDDGQNVLVVDDDDALLAVIESMINKIGKRCCICHSSLEFEEQLGNLHRYDVVLTDREMGAFSGLDVLKKVKEQDLDKRVILMTARSEYNNEVAMRKGFDAYLRKPFFIKDLADVLKVNVDLDLESDVVSEYKEDFPELCAMFDDDKNAVENILRVFVDTTSENLLAFNEIIDEGTFDKAVSLCHKMCPMFIQLNRQEDADFLYKMDALRGKDEACFPEWKEESVKFMNRVDGFVTYLYEKYGM